MSVHETPPLEDGMSMFELWKHIWRNRTLVVCIVGFFALSSVIYSLLLTNLYRAETLLVPLEEQQPIPLTAQLSFAASLSGLNFGTTNDNIQVALATLRSREFLTRFIEDHDLLPWLFASEYRSNSGLSVINEDVYSLDSATWVENSDGTDEQPTEWEAYELLIDISAVEHDRQTGMVTLAVEWPDPNLAAQWANWLVEDVNNHLRERDKQEATRAISFLEAQLESTNLIEMQQTIYDIIESQTRTLMLANVRNDYLFEVVDPAFIPEMKSSPNRTRLCILGTIFGFMVSILVVWIKSTVANYKFEDHVSD